MHQAIIKCNISVLGTFIFFIKKNYDTICEEKIEEEKN